MTYKRANMPAFPLPDGVTTTDYDGLTVKEWYAGLAMQGLLRAESEHNEQGVAGFQEIAEQAFLIADAMLAQSEKDKP